MTVRKQGRIEAKHIIFCHCGGERIPAGLIRAIDKHLKKLPLRVTKLTDLCGLVALNGEVLSDLFIAETEHLVIGCHRRSMDLLFQQVRGKADEQVSGFRHINMLEVSPGQAFDRINAFCGNYEGKALYREITHDPEWPSWYPLIDCLRCSGCGQCADFCLFGVYEKTDGRVRVVNPKGCKNNCPACARICPSTAIVFPKYINGGAIGGSEEINEMEEQKRQAKDIDSLLGGDLQGALAMRREKRRLIVREEVMGKALAERNAALGADKNKY